MALDEEDKDFAEEVRKSIFTFAHIPDRMNRIDVPKITRDLEQETLAQVIADALDWAGVAHLGDLGDLRLTRRGPVTFCFNYGPEIARAPVAEDARFLIGGRIVPPAGVSAWADVTSAA